MSTPSNIASESLMDATAQSGPIRATRPLYWSVRRELWEHRAIYIAPLAAAGVVLFGFLLGTFHMSSKAQLSFSALAASKQVQLLQLPFHFAAAAIVVTVFIVAVFYSLSALQNERRDRSILFWKSLPVSDLTTVLSKAAVPLVVLPLVTIAFVLATQLIMFVVSYAVLLARGEPALLAQVHFVQMTVGFVYAVIVLALWHAPLYGYLFLISGWARRASFLWAILPPLALVIIERLAFDTSYVSRLIGYRLMGAFEAAFVEIPRPKGTFFVLPKIDPMKFVATPGLWFGLVFAAVFFAAAIWLRRYREPI